MDSFELESGRVLENVAVEYGASGIPKYDEEGNIINAVIYCPTLKGGYSFLTDFHDSLKKGDFDKDEFYFIRIYSLGNPGSCSPSSTGLRYNFPKYTFIDRVNFKRQFLAERFNIKNFLGIIGEGIGGFEALTWASEYPDEMEYMIVANTSCKTYGYRYVMVKCAESIIDSTEDYYSDEYAPSLSKIVVAVNRLLFSGYYSQNVLESLSQDEIDVLMDDYVDEGLFMDIHDFMFRNDAILIYDVEDKLQNIKAESLILGIEGNLFFSVDRDVVQLSDSIENSQHIIFNQRKQDYFDEVDFSSESGRIIAFLEKFKR